MDRQAQNVYFICTTVHIYMKVQVYIAHYIAKIVAEKEKKEIQTQQTTPAKHTQTQS